MKTPNPRALVAYSLHALMKNQPFNHAQWKKLPARDHHFALLLYKGILRHYYPLHAILKGLSKRAPKDKIFQYILLGGLYEILILQKEDFAVVNNYVEIGKKYGSASFANAVLREAIRKRADLQKKINEISPLPHWLNKRWQKNFTADYDALIQSLKQTPQLGITVKSNAEQWQKTFTDAGYQVTQLYGDTLQLKFSGKISELPGYEEGEWWVQNIASYLASYLLLANNSQSQTILDLCAAPGGKAAYLANKNTDLTVMDISEKRMAILQDNFTRLQLQATNIVADILGYETDETYDAILLDAPCTALGTIRHNPDILLKRQEADITECARTQMAMLKKAWQWLKPNGKLLYAVCSLEPEEGIDIITEFLQTQTDAEISFIGKNELPDFIPNPNKQQKGTILLMPHHHDNMDGFFIARLYKTKTDNL